MVTSLNHFCSLMHSLNVNCNKVKFSPFGFNQCFWNLNLFLSNFKLSSIELVKQYCERGNFELGRYVQ